MHIKKVLIYLPLLLWTIWVLLGIVPNASHYSFLDWIIVIIVYIIPCSILIAIDIATSTKRTKNKIAPQNNVPLNDSPSNKAHIQQSIEKSSSTAYSEIDLLSWQNVLYPDTPQLRFDAYQLKKLSAFMIPQQSKIAHDCMELINSTLVPQTFFSRYDLLIEKLTLLSNLEKYVKFNTYSPTQQLASAMNKKTQATNRFIDRYWASTANNAKSSKVQFDLYQTHYDTLLC